MFSLKASVKRIFFSNFIKKAITGFLIGIAAITPGLSGGVIAATYGLYEPIISSLVNIKKDFNKSVKFLFPLGIGAVFGILIFSTLLQSLIKNALNELIFAFLGLIAGSLPSLIKVAGSQGFKKKYLIAFFISFSFIIAFEYMAPFDYTFSGSGVLVYFISGSILSLGTIIPGISSSIILIKLGIYESLLSALTGFQLTGCFFAGLGFVITALLLIKFVEFLFRKYRGFAYYAVLGFLLSSMVIVFPKFKFDLQLLLDAFLFLICTVFSYYITGKKN